MLQLDRTSSEPDRVQACSKGQVELCCCGIIGHMTNPKPNRIPGGTSDGAGGRYTFGKAASSADAAHQRGYGKPLTSVGPHDWDFKRPDVLDENLRARTSNDSRLEEALRADRVTLNTIREELGVEWDDPALRDALDKSSAATETAVWAHRQSVHQAEQYAVRRGFPEQAEVEDGVRLLLGDRAEADGVPHPTPDLPSAGYTMSDYTYEPEYKVTDRVTPPEPFLFPLTVRSGRNELFSDLPRNIRDAYQERDGSRKNRICVPSRPRRVRRGIETSVGSWTRAVYRAVRVWGLEP